MKNVCLGLAISIVLSAAGLATEEGIVAHYTFDEGKGAVVRDHSGHNNHGKILGGAKWVKGPYGMALELDGEDGYVDCGADESLNIASGGTVMIWCRPRTVQGGLVNWSTGGSWEDERLVLAVNTYRGGSQTCGYMSDGERFIGYGGFGGLGLLPENRWTHVALTFDGRAVSAYRDGLLVHAVSQSVEPNVKGVPLWIGKCSGLGKAYFQEVVDEVRIYGRTLPAPEILAYYKKEARARDKDLTVFEKVGLEAHAYPGPGKIIVTLDASAMQPLPEGARIRVELSKRGASRAAQQVEITPIPRVDVAEAAFDVQNAPMAQYVVRAGVVGPGDRRIGKSSSAAVNWTGQPEAFRNVKVLNNLCWELLSVKGDLRGGTRKYKFSLPCDRWVFMRTTASVGKGGTVQVALDSDRPSDAALTHHGEDGRTVEAMRYLPAGEHTLHLAVQGNATLHHLVVRAIPALQHAFYGAGPHIHPYGPYDWEFLKRDIRPNVNVMIGASPKPEHIKEWTDAGRSWISIVNAARGVKAEDKDAVEKAASIWSGAAGFQHPLMDGVIVDEFTGDEHPIYAVYHKALEKLYSNPKFKGRGFSPYTYGEGFSYAENPKKFVRVCLREGGYICREWYLTEQPTAAAARHLIRGRMTGSMKAWEKGLPGSTNRMVIVLGYMSQPTESLNIDPSVDFKVYMDMQIRTLATHPAFFGLGGIQEYHSSYCDEENVRWAGRLYRHYAIEGNTERPTSDPYELSHIRNPDFAQGTEGWTIRPAKPGSIEVRKHKGYGWLQGRYPRTSIGDTFLCMKRNAKRPNVFSRQVENLKPRRLYSMKMITGDYQDLVKEVSKKKTHAVSIKLDNVEILPGPKKSFQFIFPNCYAHKLGKFDASHNYWMNYHWRVFRAKGTRATLTVTDWKNDPSTGAPRRRSGQAGQAEPGGPIGQELMFSFVEIQPYLAEE